MTPSGIPRAQRLLDRPIIDPSTPGADERLGTNINGPSLIRVPDWLPDPLGRYYLYFAHHQGRYIRLAYADRIEGPWTIYTPGTLQLEQTRFNNHIASPDVHIDPANRRLIMYFHGCCVKDPAIGYSQITCVATSPDGLHFDAGTEWLTNSYLRVFWWQDACYGLSMPGMMWHAPDPFGRFQLRQRGVEDELCAPRSSGEAYRSRHLAVDVVGSTLWIYFSRVGDTPERLLASSIDLTRPYAQWTATAPIELLRSEHAFEGADLPVETSAGGAIHRRAHALRDPAIFREDGRCYLVYSTAGESGLGLAEITYEAQA
jgi:hypothetical protein